MVSYLSKDGLIYKNIKAPMLKTFRLFRAIAKISYCLLSILYYSFDKMAPSKDKPCFGPHVSLWRAARGPQAMCWTQLV